MTRSSKHDRISASYCPVIQTNSLKWARFPAQAKLICSTCDTKLERPLVGAGEILSTQQSESAG